jgi:hypothetical protein
MMNTMNWMNPRMGVVVWSAGNTCLTSLIRATRCYTNLLETFEESKKDVVNY